MKKSLLAVLLSAILLTPFSALFAENDNLKTKRPSEVNVLYLFPNKEARTYMNHFDRQEGVHVDHVTARGEEVTYSEVITKLAEIARKNKEGNGYDIAYLEQSFVVQNGARNTERNKQLLHGAVQSVTNTGTSLVVPAGKQSRKIKTNQSAVVPAAFPETLTIGSIKPGTSDQYARKAHPENGNGDDSDSGILNGIKEKLEKLRRKIVRNPETVNPPSNYGTSVDFYTESESVTEAGAYYGVGIAIKTLLRERREHPEDNCFIGITPESPVEENIPGISFPPIREGDDNNPEIANH